MSAATLARPVEWSAVGLALDPVPGDPDVVRRGGQRYVEVAEAIDRAASRLAALDAGSAVSQAIDALDDQRDQVLHDVRRAHARYAETGAAVVAYAAGLARAQDHADAALGRARLAVHDRDDAERRRAAYLRMAGDAPDATSADPDVLRYRDLATRAGNDAEHAAGQVGAAQRDVAEAVAARDRAAADAIDRIHAITSRDGLHDGWWDDWGERVVSQVTSVAAKVSEITGYLALAVSWIPVVGEVVGPVALALSGLTAVIAAAGTLMLAAHGDASRSDAVGAVAGAALACVGLGGVSRTLGRTAVQVLGTEAVPVVESVVTGGQRLIDRAAPVRLAIEAAPRRLQLMWSGSQDVVHVMTTHLGEVVAVTTRLNLASRSRTAHIIVGELNPWGKHSGGHLWPGRPGKTPFPEHWDADTIMEHISDVARDPTSIWRKTKATWDLVDGEGDPLRFLAYGIRDGTLIRVVVEPLGEGIISAYPVKAIPTL